MVFGRILTAMVTPFTPDGLVDYPGARRLARYLVEHGSDGLVLAGTTGEASTLTTEEKLTILDIVLQEVGKDVQVLLGTGTNCTADSVALSRQAERAGAHGIMLVVPYYNKPPQEGLYQHFKAIAEAVELPVLLYNVPTRTSRNMETQTVLRLAEIDNIIALKEAGGDMDHLTRLKRDLPQGFQIFSGEDSLTLPMMAIGISGVVSVASHLVGPQLQEMFNAFEKGDFRRASDIHCRLYPLFKALFMTTNPIPLKAALNLMKLPAGPLRPPLVEATPSEMSVLREVMKELELLEA